MLLTYRPVFRIPINPEYRNMECSAAASVNLSEAVRR
jgi:hypothetical protein